MTSDRKLGVRPSAELPEQLASSALFRGVRFETLTDLLQRCPIQRFHPGEVALAPGETNRFLHLVLSGTLHVKREAHSPHVVHAIEPGDCFGEMSILDGMSASACVVAHTAAQVLSIPEQVVWSSLLELPGVARNLLRVLTTRLRQSLRSQYAYEDMLKELALARTIQASMLPPGGSLFPDHAELDGCALMDPAAEVGGDFFDAFFVDEHRVFLTAGDVAGKGMAAALFMARSMTLLRQQALRRVGPKEVLSRLNESLAIGNDLATFVALFCGLLDVRTGDFRYANGGLGKPFLWRCGRWERPVLPRGLVVGAIGGFAFGSARLRLNPGDTLLVFTDGVSEARDTEGRMFSEERLASLLDAIGNAPSADLVTRIRREVQAHAGSSPQSDDITLLAVRYLGPPSEPAASDPPSSTF
jgi:sigma-B regulation protein RsbU (phosphoserine phosphatase)